jgi:hypothetical protein
LSEEKGPVFVRMNLETGIKLTTGYKYAKSKRTLGYFLVFGASIIKCILYRY